MNPFFQNRRRCGVLNSGYGRFRGFAGAGYRGHRRVRRVLLHPGCCRESGLVDTLKGPGPFTVFAPTDAAFAKLPAGTVEDLLKPENRSKLVAILTYHVVPGMVMAKDVVKLHEAKTVNGQELTVKTGMGSVMVDNAKVVKADILCTNGAIHVIDTVILPQ